jgi:hypothetical protein
MFEKLLTFTRAQLPIYLKSASVIFFNMGGKFATIDPKVSPLVIYKLVIYSFNVRTKGEKTCIPSVIQNSRYFAVVEVLWKPYYFDEGKRQAREWARKAADICKEYSPSDAQLRYAAKDPIFKEGNQAEYGQESFSRLVKVKKRYDPKNLFRNNLNIDPSNAQ